MDGKKYLMVNAIKGIGLKAADIGGTSDPYLVMKLGEQTYKTSVIKKTLDPNWNENFLFDVSNLNDNLIVSCLDKDLVSNDKIGDVTIPINTLVPGQENINTYKLLNVTKGEIQLGLTLDVDNSPEVENVGLISVEVAIKSARNLVQVGKDLPNPYAILYFGEKCIMTNKISGSLNPTWKGQSYRWTIDDADEKIILPVCVFDKQKTKKDEFLGLALVPLAGVNNEEKTSFYQLHGVAGGEIEITINTTRPKMEIPISDPTIYQNELERKVKFSSQFIKMSQGSQASGLKKFGSGFTSFLGIGVQFLVDNSDSVKDILGDGGNDD